ncbi:MAG: DNA methyltransferase [Cyanobacteriota bacterium]|nr:DNA methyltransferase [Cyanobacteriota bacterium]
MLDNNVSTLSPKLDSITKLFDEINKVAWDRESIPQDRLNLTHKSRKSLLPWRGQFSPEFVELLLQKYSDKTTVILDPFLGSGTTIFEAAKLGLTCYGAEINPSAIVMAKTAEFVNIDLSERKKIVAEAEAIAEEYLLPYKWDLFSYRQRQQRQINFCEEEPEEEILTKILERGKNHPSIYNVLANAVIRYLNYGSKREISDFLNGLSKHTEIVINLPCSPNKCRAFNSDARKIPYSDRSVDLIITSPPYINVFNYHQNNRTAMEMMGWNLLEVAKSEIGANRKHRQNRFLTVVQYALDLLDALKEMRRLLADNGRAIIVVGRSSKVRGVSIENGKLLAAIAIGGAGFVLEKRQERKFKNKFGELIYEDILHLVPDGAKLILGDEFALLTACWLLTEVSAKATNDEVRKEILQARERASKVKKSPLFELNNNHPK